MAGLELRYASIQECVYGIQKLPISYPAAERVPVRGEGQYIAELLTEDTSRYLDCVIGEFQKADKKKIEIS